LGSTWRGSYGGGIAREGEGKEARAHGAPIGVLSGLGEGSVSPESSAKLVGTEEEDGGVVGVAVAPSSNGMHQSKQRTAAILGDTVGRREGHGGRS
jgi:hypothetical protein